ncbi:unnamed protein product [Pedinophyceae sp. YPF-701]|nr:unnamed protein product [Pedinophyceae sp. YPF-701]
MVAFAEDACGGASAGRAEAQQRVTAEFPPPPPKASADGIWDRYPDGIPIGQLIGKRGEDTSDGTHAGRSKTLLRRQHDLDRDEDGLVTKDEIVRALDEMSQAKALARLLRNCVVILVVLLVLTLGAIFGMSWAMFEHFQTTEARGDSVLRERGSGAPVTTGDVQGEVMGPKEGRFRVTNQVVWTEGGAGDAGGARRLLQAGGGGAEPLPLPEGFAPHADAVAFALCPDAERWAAAYEQQTMHVDVLYKTPDGHLRREAVEMSDLERAAYEGGQYTQSLEEHPGFGMRIVAAPVDAESAVALYAVLCPVGVQTEHEACLCSVLAESKPGQTLSIETEGEEAVRRRMAAAGEVRGRRRELRARALGEGAAAGAEWARVPCAAAQEVHRRYVDGDGRPTRVVARLRGGTPVSVHLRATEAGAVHSPEGSGGDVRMQLRASWGRHGPAMATAEAVCPGEVAEEGADVAGATCFCAVQLMHRNRRRAQSGAPAWARSFQAVDEPPLVCPTSYTFRPTPWTEGSGMIARISRPMARSLVGFGNGQCRGFKTRSECLNGPVLVQLSTGHATVSCQWVDVVQRRVDFAATAQCIKTDACVCAENGMSCPHKVECSYNPLSLVFCEESVTPCCETTGTVMEDVVVGQECTAREDTLFVQDLTKLESEWSGPSEVPGARVTECAWIGATVCLSRSTEAECKNWRDHQVPWAPLPHVCHASACLHDAEGKRDWANLTLVGCQWHGPVRRSADSPGACLPSYYEGVRPDCFPASGSLVSAAGALRAADVRVGSSVGVVDESGRVVLEEVVAVTRAEAGARSAMVRVEVAGGAALVLSPGHLLWTRGTGGSEATAAWLERLRVVSRVIQKSQWLAGARLVAAASVVAGDEVFVVGGEDGGGQGRVRAAEVTGVAWVPATGQYAFKTRSGRPVLVDGVVASDLSTGLQGDGLALVAGGEMMRTLGSWLVWAVGARAAAALSQAAARMYTVAVPALAPVVRRAAVWASE